MSQEVSKVEKIVEQGLLYDFYGELLTDHQKSVYEAAVLEDYSLTEIAEMYGISRQGVHDNLSRAEALLRNMEEKTGCVRRDLTCRKAAQEIIIAAKQLAEYDDPQVASLSKKIVASAEMLGE